VVCPSYARTSWHLCCFFLIEQLHVSNPSCKGTWSAMASLEILFIRVDYVEMYMYVVNRDDGDAGSFRAAWLDRGVVLYNTSRGNDTCTPHTCSRGQSLPALRPWARSRARDGTRLLQIGDETGGP